MTSEKRKDLVPHLSPFECAEVLAQILKRHPELRDEANAISADMMDEISVEGISEEVSDLVSEVSVEEISSRAGKQPWGYVEPIEAAWELLDEALVDIENDMKRRMGARMEASAEKLCRGIIMGLYNVSTVESDGALGWAPDFPAEKAADIALTLLKLYPRDQSEAAGRRIMAGVEEHAIGWVEMLQRAVDRAATGRR